MALTLGEVRDWLFQVTTETLSEPLPDGILEATLVGRMAIHLSPFVEQYNRRPDEKKDDKKAEPLMVDVEYGRLGDGVKRDAGGNGRRVDLIVHQRGVPDGNMLAVEVKRGDIPSPNRQEDVDRVQQLTGPNFSYRSGAAVVLHPETEQAEVRWFVAGTPILHNPTPVSPNPPPLPSTRGFCNQTAEQWSTGSPMPAWPRSVVPLSHVVWP